MTNYLIRRGLQMIMVVFGATIAIYVLLQAAPGDPLSGINLGGDRRARFTEHEIDVMRANLGLNRPVWLGYLTWVAGEDWVDELGNAIGNPGNAKTLPVTGTWADFQLAQCRDAGGTNEGVEPGKGYPCQRGIMRGDWGKSWKLARGQDVMGIIEGRIKDTSILMASATLFSLLIAVPIGIISAVRQYSALDYAVTTFSFFGISMPAFWFGLMLVILFGLTFKNWGLPFFPTGNVVDLRILPGSIQDVLGVSAGSLGDRIIHLILPTIMLSLLYLAGWSRFLRSSMLEVLRQDYVRTARAKGLSERVVILKHATRNALIPLITIVVFQIPGIFGGAILTETIFNYPGMGRLFISALGQSDWPIVMGYLFITAILVVVATLVGDLLYTVVDPRIRFE